MVARVVSLQGSSAAQAGIMIRETLNADANHARSGNVFSMYGSPDGLNWVQLGTSQTVSMVPNVYVGLAVSSRSTSSLATASFDNVSVTSP